MWPGAILGSTYYRWGHQQARKKQNWKRATLMVVAGPAESNYERGLKMASCNDERRWVRICVDKTCKLKKGEGIVFWS